ncbi:MAG: NusG domain II-containing protein [Faecalibacterium sp.]|nr:NusG domain II-containing protein [Faecalibacterium sp.]
MNKNAFKQNLIFAAVVLLLAAGLFFWRWYAAQQAAGLPVKAQLIYGDASTVMDIPLDKAGRYDVDTGIYTIHLEVTDGAIAFVDSPCPDHICENYGRLSVEDQQAVCLPAKAVVMIVPVE